MNLMTNTATTDIEYTNVAVVNTFIVRRLSILDQYCVADSLKLFRRLKIVIKSFFYKTKGYERASWILDNWSIGYYHWFNDVLPRCFQILGRNQTHPVLIPERFLKLQYVTDSLTFLGCRYISYRDDECVLIKSLCIPKKFRASELTNSLLLETSDLFRSGMKTITSPGHRVYISRKKALRRRIINESEVIAFLEQYGFLIIEMEMLSFQEQHKLMRNTSVLISNHGAGLTNMLFMKENSIIIELCASGPFQNNCFAEMAKKLKNKYLKIESEFDNINFQQANIIVDINDLRIALKDFKIL